MCRSLSDFPLDVPNANAKVWFQSGKILRKVLRDKANKEIQAEPRSRL